MRKTSKRTSSRRAKAGTSAGPHRAVEGEVDGAAGTAAMEARKGDSEQPFASPAAARRWLESRRSEKQIDAMLGAANTGLMIATVFKTFLPLWPWIEQERGAQSRRDLVCQTEVGELMRPENVAKLKGTAAKAPSRMAEMKLLSTVASQGLDFIAAYTQLLDASEKIVNQYAAKVKSHKHASIFLRNKNHMFIAAVLRAAALEGIDDVSPTELGTLALLTDHEDIKKTGKDTFATYVNNKIWDQRRADMEHVHLQRFLDWVAR